jgi:hypothetical protein
MWFVEPLTSSHYVSHWDSMFLCSCQSIAIGAPCTVCVAAQRVVAWTPGGQDTCVACEPCVSCRFSCRYLLNLDGHTAAYRLGHLLATNSLVLKQESPQVEYYYRSVPLGTLAIWQTLHW